jgi:hypothetical protein
MVVVDLEEHPRQRIDLLVCTRAVLGSGLHEVSENGT